MLPTTTCPEFNPMRVRISCTSFGQRSPCAFQCARNSACFICILAAASHANRAWSFTGTNPPNIATIASPIYLSNAPPLACRMSVIPPRYSLSNCTRSTGDNTSENAENPWISLKNAVISSSCPPSCGSARASTIRLTSSGDTYEPNIRRIRSRFACSSRILSTLTPVCWSTKPTSGTANGTV